MGYFGSGEHVAFYWAKQTLWGTAETGASFTCVQELSGESPDAPAPKVQRRTDGSGQIFPNENYMMLGRPVLDKAFQFYATPITMRDVLMMLVQANASYGTGVYTYTPTLEPTVGRFATLISATSTRSNKHICVGDSCILTSATLNLGPFAPGDQSGSFFTLDTRWSGRYGERKTTHTYSAGETDVGSPYRADDYKIELGANTTALTEYTPSFIGGSINWGNGGHMKAGAAKSDGSVAGACLGQWVCGGNITCYYEGSSAGLATNLEASRNTPTFYMLRITLDPAGTNEVVLDIPISVIGEPRKVDQNGVHARSYDWEAVYTADANCVHQYKVKIAALSPFA